MNTVSQRTKDSPEYASERKTKTKKEIERERERERYRNEGVRYGGTGQDSVPVYGNNIFPRSRAQRDYFE